MLIHLRILFRRHFKEHLLKFLNHMTRLGYLRMFFQYIFQVNISVVAPSLHILVSYGKHALCLLPPTESQQQGASSTEISLLLTQSVDTVWFVKNSCYMQSVYLGLWFVLGSIVAVSSSHFPGQL